MTSNTPETQALLPVTAEARAAAEAHLPPMFWKEAAIADLAHAFTRFERDTIARHRQSSSNAGGVDVSALWKVHDALVAHHQWHAAQTEPDPEHGFIPADEYADSGLYEQTVAAIGVLDPYLRSGPRDTEALASLSTPTAEPPPTPDRIGKDAVREAEAWLRAISVWLLTNDHDMTLPSGILDKDPLDIADSLAAISATPAQPVDETERLRAHIAEQIEHVEQRIKDGVEMGATIWRIALEDVARENRAALQHKGEVSRG